ncbi:MAG TPA: ATP-binding cassette domain-containing protein, partial [Leptolinea sp.]
LEPMVMVKEDHLVQQEGPAGKSSLLMARNLVYRYRPGSRVILQDCSLRIHYGDRILLEGPSGGGKSTLAAVLGGLRTPENGLLLLWDFDQKTLGEEMWHQRVIVTPQFHENHIFSGSLAFNLLMGRRWPPHPTDLIEAEAICHELGLGDLLRHMPAGLQQVVGERGWRLSHGERSRIYIARALLQKADLVILDESFGSLDPENLFQAMNCAIARAPTLFVIAHP